MITPVRDFAYRCEALALCKIITRRVGRSFQTPDLQRIRQAVREVEPEIYRDVTAGAIAR